jgi:hypothetical protein
MSRLPLDTGLEVLLFYTLQAASSDSREGAISLSQKDCKTMSRRRSTLVLSHRNASCAAQH